MTIDTLRLALCQIDSVVGDVAGNTARIAAAMDEAAAAGARIAVFPELAISGTRPRISSCASGSCATAPMPSATSPPRLPRA